MIEREIYQKQVIVNRQTDRQTDRQTFSRGISLIVLVITIIVIVILAVAVILSVANNNPIQSAKEATKKSNEATLEETAKLLYNEWYQKNELNQFVNDEEKDLTAQEYIRNKLQNDFGYSSAETESVRVSEVDGEVATKYSAKFITADDYGKYVTNYTTPCGIESDKEHGIGGWQIFYADDKNIYLIASDYIYKTYAPKGKSGTEIYVNSDYCLSMDKIINDYSGTNNISDEVKDLNKMYFDKGYKGSNQCEKAVAYMLDTSVWNSKFKNDIYAEYSVGGPSLELFVNSYNKKYKNSKIELEVVDELSSEGNRGYKMRWNNNLNYDYQLVGLNTSNNIYVKNSVTRPNAMWISSPTASKTFRLIGITRSGQIRYIYFEGCVSCDDHGFRPIVCLNKEIILNKISSGFEIVN